MTFLVNEQNVSVMWTDVNAISLCLDLNTVHVSFIRIGVSAPNSDWKSNMLSLI